MVQEVGQHVPVPHPVWLLLRLLGFRGNQSGTGAIAQKHRKSADIEIVNVFKRDCVIFFKVFFKVDLPLK